MRLDRLVRTLSQYVTPAPTRTETRGTTAAMIVETMPTIVRELGNSATSEAKQVAPVAALSCCTTRPLLGLPRPSDRRRWSCRGRSESRVGACARRLGDATNGSALDCDLARREDARHGGRATPGLCSRDHRHGVTAGTADLRERASRPGCGGAPVRASAREGATWPQPRSRTVAHRFPALGPGGGARLSHAFPSR